MSRFWEIAICKITCRSGLRLSMCLDLDEPASGVLRFPLFVLFYFFFLAHISALGDKVHCSCTVEHYSRTIEPWFLTFLCTQVGLVHCSRDPQTSLFSKFFIKNESHSTIHTFKNYFATVFSVFSKISCIQTYP